MGAAPSRPAPLLDVVDESVPRGEDQTGRRHEDDEPEPQLDDLEDHPKPPPARELNGDRRLGESPIRR